MSAIAYSIQRAYSPTVKQAMIGAAGKGALKMLRSGPLAPTRNVGKFLRGAAEPFAQMSQLPLAAAAWAGGKSKFGQGAADISHRLASRMPRWAYEGGGSGTLGNVLVNVGGPAVPFQVAATALGGDRTSGQAEGAAFALKQLRQQYDQIPWYQKMFGGTQPVDDLIGQSDPRVLEAMRKLYPQ